MGDVRPHRPVLRLLALFSRYPEALAWGKDLAQQHWGPIALESEPFAFTETQFYEQQMGTGILKCFLAFETLIDPADLVDSKLASNAWELQYQQQQATPEPRPLNLDPGYVSDAKLVLATTKDRDHRLYLDRGIYAEVTLHFRQGVWQVRPWTYPDYQRADYHQFFLRCRDYLRSRYRASSRPDG